MITFLAQPAEIAKSLDDLQRAEERIRAAQDKQRWRELVAAMKAAAPALLATAEIVEASWFTIPAEKQDQFVQASAVFRDLIGSQPKPKNIAQRVSGVFRSLWIAAQQSDLFPFLYALMRFMVAIDRALAHEARHFAKAEACLEHDPEAQAAMRRGEADAEARRGRGFTVEEFRERFNFG
jgi:hypothetical protein